MRPAPRSKMSQSNHAIQLTFNRMDPEIDIQPKDGAASAAPVPPQSDESEAPVQLPPELLHIPAMQALVAGSPPAISAPIKEFASNPVGKLIVANKDLLQQAGMGFYRSMSGDIGVVFNMLHVHPQDLQAADKAGKLNVLAPPFDAINHAVGKSGLRNPVLSRGAVPNGFKPPTPQSPAPAGPAMNPAPKMPTPNLPKPGPAPKTPVSGLQRQIFDLRRDAVAPGTPTTGPAPGAGRLLNSILKPGV